jgi:hypothetical protein
MARYIAVDEWPGSVIYASIHGRLYCAAPRGLIPEYPYTMDTLRPPSEQEQVQWGHGVQPRMVIDVTAQPDLPQCVRRRTLQVAPWNSYLVLHLAEGEVIVAYRRSREVPLLDEGMAGQVALASGIDVDGWTAEIRKRHGNEQWYFWPPSARPRRGSDPPHKLF